MGKKDMFLLLGVLPAGIVVVVLFTVWQTSAPELATPVFEDSSTAPPSAVADELPDPVSIDQPSTPSLPNSAASAKNNLVSAGEDAGEKTAPMQPAVTPPRGAPQPSVFPTEERIWTNLSGKIMLASALHYDAERNVLLLRNNKGQLFPDYAISKLSAVDREFLENLIKSEGRSKN